ncbi:Fanconi anemia core complex-associated protein 100 isoform X2 [Gambusia affinis]|uniref:Fanconi anemia core complex-associated protein 100 isoform X2 n=1 Tax=Gambusia affinis TaxID=33528 RepID=UPI001CDBCB8C|nr:Fanconi anemia core complex-associated protein 100 isoform X2 [Gambusia affinis]
MMEGRCAAEPWAEFGLLGKSGTPLVKCGTGTDVFICTGGEEVFVFTAQEKTLRAVLQMPAAVRDLAVSPDEQLLFVACWSGVYSVKVQLLVPSSSHDAGSGPTEVKISTECLVAVADRVSSLLVVGSVLLTLCRTDSSWSLTLYQTQRASQSDPCDLLASFSLPLVSPSVQGDTESRCVLVCVYPGDVLPASSTPRPSSSHFPLQPLLFRLLFGAEAALSKSPVVLCGLPDGRLSFLPLRIPGSRLRILHSLEQPVVFVGASAVMETDAGSAGCLIALGKQGRAVLIRAGRAGSEGGGGARFTLGCVPGPVECACMDQGRVYYSTGSDLLSVDLWDGSSGTAGRQEDEGSRSNPAALLTPVSLNVSRVAALHQPTCSSAGEGQLLSLSVRGRLQSIRLPVRTQEDGLSKRPSSQVGRSVGDILSAIGDVCERASVLKTIIRSKNQVLKQLNQVMNISFLLTNRSESDSKPVRCRGLVRWSRLLQRDSLNLTCVLENLSPFVLERGWTLSVAVLPLSCPLEAGGEASSVNYSFPFGGLGPGESVEVSLPVAAEGDASFPVTVTCSLLFSLWKFLGQEEATAPLDSQRACFSLPLNTLTVDWLHALRLGDPPAPARSSSNPADLLQGFISSRQLRCRGGGQTSRPEEYSARVRVSSELLRDALGLTPGSPRVSLLEWLLSEGCGGVKTERKGIKTDGSSSVICGRAPNNAAVKLTAVEVNMEEKTEPLVTMEVQVKSSSVAAVCGLHHAVLRRIQTLLQKAASSRTVPIADLRLALQQAESEVRSGRPAVWACPLGRRRRSSCVFTSSSEAALCSCSDTHSADL